MSGTQLVTQVVHPIRVWMRLAPSFVLAFDGRARIFSFWGSELEAGRSWREDRGARDTYAYTASIRRSHAKFRVMIIGKAGAGC